jgi:hypothetical protein
VRTQTLYEFRPSAARSTAVAPSPLYRGGNVVSITESPAFFPTPEDVREAVGDGLGCARGLRAAFLLEGGMGLLVSGIWLLWHLAR